MREASRGLRRMSRQRVLEKLPAGSALLFAGSQHCLCARIPLPVHQATAPVSNRPVNNTMPNPLPNDIIDRRHRSIKQKPEHLTRISQVNPCKKYRARGCCLRQFCCSDLENPMGESQKDALRVNFEKKGLNYVL